MSLNHYERLIRLTYPYPIQDNSLEDFTQIFESSQLYKILSESVNEINIHFLKEFDYDVIDMNLPKDVEI